MDAWICPPMDLWSQYSNNGFEDFDIFEKHEDTRIVCAPAGSPRLPYNYKHN